MKKFVSCVFNMDAGCVELRYSDGDVLHEGLLVTNNSCLRKGTYAFSCRINAHILLNDGCTGAIHQVKER